MFVDTHCHLNFHAFTKDVADVVERARERGVRKIIIPGAKIDSSRKAIEISHKFPECFAAVGIHPHHFIDLQKISKQVIYQELTKLAKENKVVAIGEVGFDNHRYRNYPPLTKDDKNLQRDLFELQLAIAKEQNLPLVIHNREAEMDFLALFKSKMLSFNVRGVFHCFEGTPSFLHTVLHQGFSVGFDGNTTYRENNFLRELVKVVPLDQLLLETDSPFLTPEPKRGSRNEPSYLPYLAEIVARIHSIPLEKLADQTTRNASSLFRLSERVW
ncbi:TatD family hydrolase [Candidatus Gottesmanbacteria bacterium]|nr:TatD family hydrolase [Candidatus Gottesmanbacteria bacterium]